MIKTLSFACLHFFVAFTVAYLLTGSMLVGGLIALLEPSVNTLAFYCHERVWQLQRRRINPLVKTVSFAVVHFSVAFTVVFLLTGDALVGGLMALIEPSINTFVYYVHERVWQRSAAGHEQNCVSSKTTGLKNALVCQH